MEILFKRSKRFLLLVFFAFGYLKSHLLQSFALLFLNEIKFIQIILKFLKQQIILRKFFVLVFLVLLLFRIFSIFSQGGVVDEEVSF